MENVEDIYPLSPVQSGMLFHHISDPGALAYVEQYSCTLSGDINVEALKRSWDVLVESHPALRTGFLWDGLDEPVQVVRRRVQVPWEVDDWRSVPEGERRSQLQRYLSNDREKGFDLSKAPLMRMSLIRLSDRAYRFVWTYHHIISDNWSTVLLLKEFHAGYEALLRSETIAVVDRPAYRNYIGYLQGLDSQEAMGYWGKALEGFDRPTSLRRVGCLGGSSEHAGEHGREQLDLSLEKTRLVMGAARRARLTVNTMLLGAWGLLLGRYSGESDVVFGGTVSGRPTDLAGVDQMAGAFINTLPIRVTITEDTMVGDWLSKLQVQQSQVMQYQHTPLVDVHGCSGVRRGESLFDTILVSEGFAVEQPAVRGDGGAAVSDVHYEAHSNYPVALIAVPGDRLELILIHDLGWLDAEAAKRVLGHVETLLVGMAEGMDGKVSAIPMLTAGERGQVLDDWGAGESIDGCEACLHELFEAQVVQTPDLLAVVSDDQSLTYAQVEAQSNQLAWYLRGKGVVPGQMVGVCLERSPRLVVALLGILKAGGAYVPLDPEYPPARLMQMVEDAGVSMLVSQAGLEDRVGGGSVPVVMIDSQWEAIGSQDDGKLDSGVTNQDVAYVIFTSGSTGRPAGVMVTHANVAFSTMARQAFYNDAPTRYMMLSSYAFDSSVAGLFWPICCGGAVCLPAAGRHVDLGYLNDFVLSHGVTHLLCVPSFYRELIRGHSEGIRGIRVAIVAGEACTGELVRMHFEKMPGTLLYNEYGPTEATVWCVAYECKMQDADARAVPIGKPIPGVQVHLLDRGMGLVPLGVPGEIYVGGPGVAKGYVGLHDLTEQRFVEDPYAQLAQGWCSGRLYKTGDLARYRDDGCIEFLGRIDHQVKVRGYRVELGEIEAALSEHPAIDEVVVVVQEGDTGEVDRASVEGGRRWMRKDNRYEVAVRINDEEMVRPPRDSQREWLVNQLVQECADDLEYLHEQAGRFVPGTDEPDVGTRNFSQDGLDADGIMEDWQSPIMRAMARQVTETHGDVLEIGFGRGVSAGMIQDMGVRSHTIIEASDDCVKNFFDPWRTRLKDRDIRLVRGKWQDVLEQLGLYDGVFFHAVPLDEQEFIDYMVNSVTFAEHVFPAAAQVLKPGGVFTYFSTEIDTLSRRHQRLIFKHFSQFTLSVQPLVIPEDTRDMWWADSMVIVKAVK